MTGFDLAVGEWDGERVMFVLPDLPDDAPEAIREGIARRRITVLTGRCPCGAGFRPPNRAEWRKAARTGQFVHTFVVHEDDCPARDSALMPAIREWKRVVGPGTGAEVPDE